MTQEAKNLSKIIRDLSNLKDISEVNYFTILKYLLYLEQYYTNEKSLSKKIKVQLLPTQLSDKLCICLENSDEDFSSLMSAEGSSVQLQKVNNPQSKKYSLKVIAVNTKLITLEADYEFMYQHRKQDFYYLELNFSNWPIRMCHYAVQLMEEDKYFYISMFPLLKKTSNEFEAIIQNWIDKNIEKNPEQMQAIKRIIGRTSYPSPYILFGPPGTGKTATIIEAVLQISRLWKNSNILICTPSNAAADDLTKRLLLGNVIPKEAIYRMMSPSVELKSVDKSIYGCIHFENGKVTYLQRSDIIFKKIVITTLITCGRLLRMSSLNNHFKYIFIDEAGQATQPETFIPLALLKTHKDCQIVLSGDPKQLRPVVMTRLGLKLLGKSMLERLMENTKLYQQCKNGQYDPNYITKLVKNYRSHEAILKLPNQMFYKNELTVCGGQEIFKAENLCHLPKKKFPIIFHAVFGYEKKDVSQSVANEAEAAVVLNYVEKLINEEMNGFKVTTSDIGIVTPYQHQKSIIMKAFKTKGFQEIPVGTVESFQGQEKDIIIVSTVRSNKFQGKGKFSTGFLADEKRFNVTITRAKCLLIIIGNPKLLRTINCWQKFINYCQKNKAYCVDKSTEENWFSKWMIVFFGFYHFFVRISVRIKRQFLALIHGENVSDEGSSTAILRLITSAFYKKRKRDAVSF